MFHPQCDFIVHAKDVDVGIHIEDFRWSLVPAMRTAGLELTHRFGRVNDSLELSFKGPNGLKLDCFFFYTDVRVCLYDCLRSMVPMPCRTRYARFKDSQLMHRRVQEGYMWNGGTQARTGRKFKYRFPPFDLCWAELTGIRVRVPCNPLPYVQVCPESRAEEGIRPTCQLRANYPT